MSTKKTTDVWWSRFSNILGICVVLVFLLNQLTHLMSILGGPQYVCATRVVPPPGASDGQASADASFFPPTFLCHFPSAARDGTYLTIDMFPFGAWIFWSSLLILILVFVGKTFLHRRTSSFPDR